MEFLTLIVLVALGFIAYAAVGFGLGLFLLLHSDLDVDLITPMALLWPISSLLIGPVYLTVFLYLLCKEQTRTGLE